MKSMLKLSLVLCSMAVNFAIQAQDDSEPLSITQKAKKTPEQHAAYFAEKLNSVATLSAEQKTKVYDLALRFEKQKAEAKALSDKEAMKAAIKTAAKERRTDLYAILDAEQKVKWEAYKAEKKEEMKKTGGKFRDDDDADGM